MNLTLFPPKSGWVPPTQFPNLSKIKVLGIDLETKDPLLKDKGPGSFRKDGHVCGVSLSTGDLSWYFPIRHVCGGNMDVDNVRAFLGDLFKEHRTWVGANLQYEMEWLKHEGFSMKGDFVDVQVIEALIDEEYDSYSLQSLCNRHGLGGKDETLLREAASAHGIDPKSDLHKLHSRYVGPYAEFDALAPLKIWEQQEKEIARQGLEEIVTLEKKVTPILWEMREQGIRVDLEEAKKLSDRLKEMEEKERVTLKQRFGFFVDEWSGQQLARICDQLQILYPRTKAGNPSFRGEWLDDHDHPFLQSVSTIRELNRLRNVFIDQWVFCHQIDGIVHPQWLQIASDDGGTRTGRLAAMNPNPQQVPSRSDLAPLIRSLFVPVTPGHEWCKYDYSQQEPRIAVHFSYICGFTSADVVRMAYRDNPDMDIYKFLAESAQITRRESKDLTLGRFYGMGAKKLAHKLGCTVDQAKAKLEEFDSSVPFVRDISELCRRKAEERGWIKTLCGRKRHFNTWEPSTSWKMREEGYSVIPLRREAAEAKWPNHRLIRFGTQKALNSLIQGSAADMTKSAMVQIREREGLVPFMQVHDELNYGTQKGDVETQQKIKENCENCVKTEVPIRADVSIGGHWK